MKRNRILFVVCLSFCSAFAAASSTGAVTPACFERTDVQMECAPGTEFIGWDVGACPEQLVERSVCTEPISSNGCMDPGTAMRQCTNGTFRGWIKGHCPGVMVLGADCGA